MARLQHRLRDGLYDGVSRSATRDKLTHRCVRSLTGSAGYYGRLLLHNDPFSDFGFKLNVTLLTVAPAFISASLYLTLKSAIVVFGQNLSRLRPAWYAYVFIACDAVSIVLQGAGGALSAVAEQKSLLDLGVHIMIAGLVSQVVTLTIFVGLVVEYVVRCRRNRDDLNPGSLALVHSARFQLFAAAMVIAFFCIFARCCFRVAELWGGWGNHIMREEADFIILDSDMCALATLLMSIFHPQIFFKMPERVRLSEVSADMELPVQEKVQPLAKVRPLIRVTLNDYLTEWEREGVRSAQHRPGR
ncbi:hypothetical protein LTR53_007213 [Teratosphaeriaceae sp. CCFEE 6253]|nr:hypothetical protein LTR53_007213 [Teratosphaeriaceae sp. CCFEE 6253]